MECPYCKEEIQDGALKCKHCGSMLNAPETSQQTSAFGCFAEAVKKYAVFRGRARRREYWFFILFYILISLAVSLIDGLLGLYDSEAGIGVLSAIYSLAMLVPSLAVSVRRLHDTNRSGWWLLIGLIPLVGAIVLLIFFIQDGKDGENKHGANPKLAIA